MGELELCVRIPNAFVEMACCTAQEEESDWKSDADVMWSLGSFNSPNESGAFNYSTFFFVLQVYFKFVLFYFLCFNNRGLAGSSKTVAVSHDFTAADLWEGWIKDHDAKEPNSSKSILRNDKTPVKKKKKE